MNAIPRDDRIFTAVGLMSGTSMDGIDAAVVRTDGRDVVEVGASSTLPYAKKFRERLRRLVTDRGRDAGEAKAVEKELTLIHVEAVERLLTGAGLAADQVDLLGFHGQTVFHDPSKRFTWQIGDGALLAKHTGVPVVGGFRLADVAAGGQGAPFVPLYHAALAAGLAKPVAVLNVGGVANVTWLGADGAVVAFDCGPGNALIDDLVHAKTGRPYDASGTLSLSGKPDSVALAKLLDNPYFDLAPPKSLDRNAFDPVHVAGLSTQDAAATLAAFTVQAAARSILKVGNPKTLLVCGGGRLNRAIMAGLATALPGVRVRPVEGVGWRGDVLEAEAFGFLAVRSVKGLPLSVPTTTGVPEPTHGGVLYAAPGRVMEFNRATVV